MKLNPLSLCVGIALICSGAATGCADAEPDDTETAAGEIRGPKDAEILGTLALGDRTSFDYTYSTTKRYRAYKIALGAGESVVLDATATATENTAGEGVPAAPMMWLTTAASASIQEAPLVSATNIAGADHATIQFTAARAMTVYALFREKSLARAKFSVALSRAAATDDPFDPASCSGALMTRGRMAELLGPGGEWKLFPPKPWLTRRRFCNAATGCTAFNSATPAILRYENSGERDRTFIDAEVTVAPALAVISGELRFGIKGISAEYQMTTSNGTRFFNREASDTQGFTFEKSGLGLVGNSPQLVRKTETFTAEDVHMTATNSCIRLWKKSSTSTRDDEWAQLWRF